MKVKDLMTKELIKVHPEDTLLRAASLMAEYKISGLPVVDRQTEKLVGIITQFDLMKKWLAIHVPSVVSSLAEGQANQSSQTDIGRYQEGLVADVMTKNVITVRADNDIKKATRLLIENDINPLPVLNTGEDLVGIISRSDIVGAVDRSMLVDHK